MLSTLIFYISFAVGEAALVMLVVNVLFGMGWKARSMEAVALLALAVVGLASLELTRRWWLVPLSEWPILLQIAGLVCCLTAIVGLPVATLARWHRNRKQESEIRRVDTRYDLVGDGPRDRFIGKGAHHWLLRIPGNEALGLVVHEWSAPVPGLPRELDGLSILHLTDLHFSHAFDRRYFEAVFDVAANSHADLVLITGDLIDDPDCIAWITPLFERLPGLFGRFAILGNHDHMHHTRPILDAVAAAGFMVLDGGVSRVEVMGKALAIGGTCHPWGPYITDEALIPADFRLLLSHTPDMAYRAARQGWDLVLCGHNHGGQVRLPVVGPVLMPSRFSRRFEEGFYRVGATLMYVSRGLGAKHPIRFRCPPEISHITLRMADAASEPPLGRAIVESARQVRV